MIAVQSPVTFSLRPERAQPAGGSPDWLLESMPETGTWLPFWRLCKQLATEVPGKLWVAGNKSLTTKGTFIHTKGREIALQITSQCFLVHLYCKPVSDNIRVRQREQCQSDSAYLTTQLPWLLFQPGRFCPSHIQVEGKMWGRVQLLGDASRYPNQRPLWTPPICLRKCWWATSVVLAAGTQFWYEPLSKSLVPAAGLSVFHTDKSQIASCIRVPVDSPFLIFLCQLF